MRHNAKIGVVIPARNEAPAIGKVIAAIPDWVDRIVVGDNGSTDNTAAIARQAGAEIASEPCPGYGAACLKALQKLEDMDIIVFLDGDFADDPAEMPWLVDPIIEHKCDLVIGSRVRGDCEPGALTPQQRFGNALACWLMKHIHGANFTDLGPFRAIRRQALAALDMQDRNYGWTVEMQLKAVIQDLACCEIPVSYRRRIGVSKVSGTIRGSVLAGIKILYLIARHTPLRRPRRTKVK